MKAYTDITVLLDRSGSMTTIKNDMEGALATFVKEHSKVPSTRFTLIHFDSVEPYDVKVLNSPIGQVEESQLKIAPRGSTPLFDAFVKTIDRTGQRLSELKESERPDQVLFVVITDGEENASHQFGKHDVNQRISLQHNVYKWQFVYLGANQDAITTAQSLGIPSQFAINYGANTKGIQNVNQALIGSTMSYVSRSDESLRGFTKSQRDAASGTGTKTDDNSVSLSSTTGVN